jgi:hypothetical protein
MHPLDTFVVPDQKTLNLSSSMGRVVFSTHCDVERGHLAHCEIEVV